MKLLDRIKNLWKLSAYEPSSADAERHASAGDKFAMIRTNAKFIPYQKIDPITDFINKANKS